MTFYVLFFLHLASRKARIVGITEHPTEQWMMQMARNWAMVDNGFLEGRRYLIHHRDPKYCAAFRTIIRDAGVEPLGIRQGRQFQCVCGAVDTVDQKRSHFE